MSVAGVQPAICSCLWVAALQRAPTRRNRKSAICASSRVCYLLLLAIVQALCASALRSSRRNKHKAADVGLHNQSMTRENGGLTPWKV